MLKKLLELGVVSLGTQLTCARLGQADESRLPLAFEAELHPALTKASKALLVDEGAQSLATLASPPPAASDGNPPTDSADANASESTGSLQPDSPARAHRRSLATSDDPDVARLEKIRRFNEVFTDDVFLTPAEYDILIETLKRINRVQAYVGHGKFNILGFDDMLKYARRIPEIGRFRQNEKALMDRLFFADAAELGFFGKKVITRMTHQVPERDVIKVPYTGHYLYQGDALKLYRRLRNDIGEKLILTSGVRGVVKQYQLFMAKAANSAGNLSKASRSLAPPGHSYHGIGDFDVGKVGLHKKNFTAAFAESDVYREIRRLDYIGIRYTAQNAFGVRFEPWHMRVIG